MKDRIPGLVFLLLDESASYAERDDAAMELGNFSDPRIIQPLISIAADPNADDVFVETCAQSLAEVWTGLGYYDKEVVKKMPSHAQNEIIGIFSVRRPDWHKELVAYLDWQTK